MPDPTLPAGPGRTAYEAESKWLDEVIPGPRTLWDDLDPEVREVYGRIAGTVAAAVHERLAAVIPPAQFRSMADWFDTDDEFKSTMFPETWTIRSHELQDDLRKFAELLGGTGRDDHG